MANLINIDGTIINLDHVERIKFNEGIDELLFYYPKDVDGNETIGFKGDNARRAYEWLQSACVATFTDSDTASHDEHTLVDIVYTVRSGWEYAPEEYYIYNLKTDTIGKRFVSEQAAFDYADLLNDSEPIQQLDTVADDSHEIIEVVLHQRSIQDQLDIYMRKLAGANYKYRLLRQASEWVLNATIHGVSRAGGEAQQVEKEAAIRELMSVINDTAAADSEPVKPLDTDDKSQPRWVIERTWDQWIVYDNFKKRIDSADPQKEIARKRADNLNRMHGYALAYDNEAQS